MVLLKYLKEINPIDVSEFVKARGADREHDFFWQSPFMLRKRDPITSKADARIRKTTHKQLENVYQNASYFGDRLPKMVDDFQMPKIS